MFRQKCSYRKDIETQKNEKQTKNRPKVWNLTKTSKG